MTCASVKEHLVDFLYDELSAEERALFAEHLRGCPACSAEVEGYRKTLNHARSALTLDMAEKPPARVREAILAGEAAAKPSARAAAVRSRDAEPGFLAKLWRTPWLLPALGAASVATVVFLVRVLTNPDVVPGQSRHGIEESGERLGTMPAPSATAAPEAHGTAAEADNAAPAANRAMPRTKRGDVHAKRTAQGAPSNASSGRPPGWPSPARFASPPPPRPAPVPLSTDERAAAKSRGPSPASDEVDMQPPTPGAGPSPSPAQVPRSASRAAGSAAAPASRPNEPESVGALAQRLREAERLFSERRWGLAAEAYRDLLRRFPEHPDAPTWRTRLAHALTERESAARGGAGKDAKAKPATTDDTADEPNR